MQQFCYSFYDVKLEITIREAQIGIFTKKEGITADHDRNVFESKGGYADHESQSWHWFQSQNFT